MLAAAANETQRLVIERVICRSPFTANRHTYDVKAKRELYPPPVGAALALSQLARGARSFLDTAGERVAHTAFFHLRESRNGAAARRRHLIL